jgi:16S rRNA (cytosine1402-N4)-methyltransferase
VQYVLFDYGISSYHFDRSGRGFTFRDDEPLDMRLDGSGGQSAADLVNRASAEELADIFYRFGEERWSRKIAAYIKEQRQKEPFETTGQLASLVMRAIPRRFHVKNIHPATRVFQALRIAVNNELDAIESGLKGLYSFSGYGRQDHGHLLSLAGRQDSENPFQTMGQGLQPAVSMVNTASAWTGPLVSVVTKKPVLPGETEIAENNRARSARLRVCERI